MLSITVPKGRVYDSKTNTFYHVDKETVLQLEHSLISLQKWESRWHKSFLKTKSKTFEESIDYVRCMCLTSNVKDDVFYCLSKDNIEQITNYIEDDMTATTITMPKNSGTTYGKSKKNDVMTAEIIYYLMISYNIPSEYRKWHLNQLLTLIQVFNVKNDTSKKKKRSTRAILSDYKAINEANKKKFNTKG